jgi:hypothetical protein
MDYNYHHPYTYPKTLFYTPAHNGLQYNQPLTHYQMESSYAAAAAQLRITIKEFTAINNNCIRQQQEFVMAKAQEYMEANMIKHTQPQPPSDPAQYEQHEYLQVKSIQPPYNLAELTIHTDLAAAQLGLTKDKMEEVLEDQEKWMGEEKWRDKAEELTTTETQHL